MGSPTCVNYIHRIVENICQSRKSINYIYSVQTYFEASEIFVCSGYPESMAPELKGIRDVIRSNLHVMEKLLYTFNPLPRRVCHASASLTNPEYTPNERQI